VGVLLGRAPGVVAGLVMGAARAGGSSIAPFGEAGPLALTSSTVLYMLAGGVAGEVMDRVRRAEVTMARTRAREEVARTLHDGVLQTLAAVQRRSPDPELAALAREQELELRAFLAGDDPAEVDLAAALRRAAAHIERHHGLRCEVVVIDDEHEIDPSVVAAVAGAAREAMNNAAKHASASRVTILLDVGEEVFVSVKDDGVGFDPEGVTAGRGLSESINARMAEVGGRASVDGRPGDGAEVRLVAPVNASGTG
jgi:signal transduction histidine kinase